MIVLNERIFAEECIRKNNMNGKPFDVLIIIANYYYSHCGFKKDNLTDKLRQFFVNSDSATYFKNQRYWDDTIEYIVRNIGNYPLHEIDGVWITAKELETIKQANSDSYKRLLFTLLCLAKLSKLRNPQNDYWVNNDYKEIFRLARVTCKKDDRYRMIGKLHKDGYIEIAKRIDNLSVRVLFVDDKTIFDVSAGDLFISDFRELGYEYLFATGGNFIRCAECEILTRGDKKGNKKYCNSCAGYTPQRIKTIVCVDCGKEFNVDARTSNKCRCDNCQTCRNAELNRESSKLRMRKYREKQKKQ